MDLPVCVILELPTTVSIVFCYMYVFCVRRNVINRSRNISLEVVVCSEKSTKVGVVFES